MSRCSKNAWAPQLNNLSQNDCGKDKGSETSQRHRPRNPICSSTPPRPSTRPPTPEPSEACPGATRFAPETPDPGTSPGACPGTAGAAPETPDPRTPGACPGLEACKMVVVVVVAESPPSMPLMGGGLRSDIESRGRVYTGPKGSYRKHLKSV